MIKATPNDKEHIAFLLANAFKDNQSVNYIIRQDKDKTNRIHALMEYSFDMCYHFGEVYLSGDGFACALLLPPKAKRKNWRSIWLDFKLILNAIGVDRIRIALKREAAIKERQLKSDIQYLWFIGVDPTYQHTGIGSNLLKEILAKADKDGLTVCLETSTSQNLPWYQRFGFEIYDELDLGYRLYFLKRNPEN